MYIDKNTYIHTHLHKFSVLFERDQALVLYMYIDTHIYVHTYFYIYILLNIHIYIHIYTCFLCSLNVIRFSIHMYAVIYIYVHTYFIYVCWWINIITHIFTHGFCVLWTWLGILCIHVCVQRMRKYMCIENVVCVCVHAMWTYMCTENVVCVCVQRMWYIRVHTATHCNTLQHTATHCNTLQHTHVVYVCVQRMWTRICV